MLVRTLEIGFKKEDGSSYLLKIPYAKEKDNITNTDVNDFKDLVMEIANINGQRLVECTGAYMVEQDITELTEEELNRG